MTHTILLVDDEPNVLEGLIRVLHKEPYEILTANTAEEAAGLLECKAVDLIVSDEEMPGMTGTEFLACVARDYPDIVGIVLTGNPTLPTALRAINEGKVYQFFTKPCNEIDLAVTIRRALEQKVLKEKSRELLEVTKCQSALIDEARMLRRLRGMNRKDRSTIIAKDGRPIEQQELLDAIDGEIRRGKDVLREVRNSQDDSQDNPNEAGQSVASSAIREDTP